MWLNGLERCASSTATGPQNATVAAFSNDIKSKASRSDVIGRAIACTTWIVEPNIHDLLASVGAVGELIIEGPILARGYLDDPEKTDLAFVYPKWLAEDTSGEIQRVYKTEDLVRYDSDGSIVYLGRKDTQVKLHGQRVEIGEIENHLWSHPLVKYALVLLQISILVSQVLWLESRCTATQIPTLTAHIYVLSSKALLLRMSIRFAMICLRSFPRI
jgi:acyl-CoA synthetase (AMP-forming)/AMP-acid ligase II